MVLGRQLKILTAMPGRWGRGFGGNWVLELTLLFLVSFLMPQATKSTHGYT